MMLRAEAEALLKDVSYRPGWVLFTWGEEPAFYMRWAFWDSEGSQMCRTWYLDLTTATKSDVIQTALRGALDAAEHEVREQFKYRGHSLYGPHFDPDALAELSSRKANLSLPEPV